MKYAYNTVGGTLEIDLHESFARVGNLDKPKLFTGSDANAIHQKIVNWIHTEIGGFNYRIMSNGEIKKLDQATLLSNLNRFKNHQRIQSHIAQRLAGAYDVAISQLLVNNEYAYKVNTKIFKYPKGYLAIDKGLKWVAEQFAKQGYFKIWRIREGEQPIKPGLAPIPVTDYRLVSSDGSLL